METKSIMVEFSPAERQFYDALHRKSLNLFEGFIKAGTATKSWLVSKTVWLSLFLLIAAFLMKHFHVAGNFLTSSQAATNM